MTSKHSDAALQAGLTERVDYHAAVQIDLEVNEWVKQNEKLIPDLVAEAVNKTDVGARIADRICSIQSFDDRAAQFIKKRIVRLVEDWFESHDEFVQTEVRKVIDSAFAESIPAYISVCVGQEMARRLEEAVPKAVNDARISLEKSITKIASSKLMEIGFSEFLNQGTK